MVIFLSFLFPLFFLVANSLLSGWYEGFEWTAFGGLYMQFFFPFSQYILFVLFCSLIPREGIVHVHIIVGILWCLLLCCSSHSL